MRCDLVLPTLFVQEVQVGLREDCRDRRGTHLGNAPWVELPLGAVEMFPLSQVNMIFGLGDEFIITMSLDFAEEDIAVRHRAKRIQGRAGCWGWGGFFDTIDVDLDRVVAVVFFGVSRYFFGMGHISSP